MNPAALTALIADLYEQLVAAKERIGELEAQLAASESDASGEA